MRVMLAALVLVAGGPAAAQNLPDALQRNPALNPDGINAEQRRRLEERVEATAPAPDGGTVATAPRPAEAAAGAAEVRFVLRALAIDPSAYLPRPDLDALAQPLVGREVSLADLRGVVAAINRLYDARGLATARAILPAQDVVDGTVRIQLVEGRIGTVTVNGGSPRAQRHARRHGAPDVGALASPSSIAGRLRRFNGNNDAQLNARLAPGTTPGATDVILDIAQPQRVSADVFVDNNGFASTGTFELGAVLRFHRLLSDADRASLALVASQGVRSASANVSTPIGDSLRIGASMSYGRTRVLYGAIAPLGVEGTSFSVGADASALLLVDDRTTVTAVAGVQTGLSRTSVAGRQVIANDAVTFSTGLAGSYSVPGLTVTVQHQLAYAHVRETLSNRLVAPLLFQGSAFVAKALGPNVSARLRGDWQVTTRRGLPGILQYQIGGARSSRAFTPGAAGGDNGLSTAAELAYAIRRPTLAIEPFALLDHAIVTLPGATGSATSLGAGLSLEWAPGIALRGSIATGLAHRGEVRGGTRAFVSTTFRF